MSQSISLKGNEKSNILYAADDLYRKMSGELVDRTEKNINNGKIILMIFEKYFYRTGSYAALTIMLTDDGNQKEAEITGFGGGAGLLNISWGANEKLASEAEEILRNNGFN